MVGVPPVIWGVELPTSWRWQQLDMVEVDCGDESEIEDADAVFVGEFKDENIAFGVWGWRER